MDVEAEVNKHKTCKDRDKLERIIQEYKSLMLQQAKNLTLAGQYNTVILKLQAICDKLPRPQLKNVTGRTQGAPVKTATITSEENTKINDAWNQRAGSTRDGGKQ